MVYINVRVLLPALLLSLFFLLRIDASGEKDASDGGSAFVLRSGPAHLTHEELSSLAKAEVAPEVLLPKLETLLTTPFASNEAFIAYGHPSLSVDSRIGQFIRVACWNIERGETLDRIRLAFEDPDAFIRAIESNSDTSRLEIRNQLEVLRTIDVLVLNEVDYGLRRTGYRDVARELADILKMNYVYGIEFVEIEESQFPKVYSRRLKGADKESAVQEAPAVEEKSYRGFHGSAVLSRFPIRTAQVIPLKYQPYDWYTGERNGISLPEAARRKMSSIWFSEMVRRELRYGGRSVLIAELAIPQLPEGGLTIVATHLENRCKPSQRRRQMQEVLSLIRDIRGPVVLLGDLNTSGSNMRPTGYRDELMKRIRSEGFWTRQMIRAAVPFSLAIGLAIESVSFAKTAADPTARGLFLLAPSKEAQLFRDIENMRFSDGYGFDFRGDPERTVNGTGGTLANSNQRSRKKGFVTTHAMPFTYGLVGKSKLDWILVKAYTRQPRGRSEPYRMAPHFPRTLEKLNSSMRERLSDHSPLTVDLPITEPGALRSPTRR